MRYTTLIDITEIPEIYRSANIRLLYLHLALKAGWHDENRDKVKVSIRKMAEDCGLTVSATRHAISVLQKHKLLAREGVLWTVKKWILDSPPTPRPKKAAETTKEDFGKRQEREIREYQNRILEAVRQMTTEELQEWLTELQEGRSLRHKGVQLNPNQANIRWLSSIIKKL